MYNYNTGGYMTGGPNPYSGQPSYNAYNSNMNPYGPIVSPCPPGYQQNTQTNLPIIQAKMIQVENKSVVDKFAVGIGETAMFITKDDKQIFFKTGLADGTTQILTYTKEEPKAVEKTDYITREEFQKVINSWQNNLNELKAKANPGKGKTGGNA